MLVHTHHTFVNVLDKGLYYLKLNILQEDSSLSFSSSTE